MLNIILVLIKSYEAKDARTVETVLDTKYNFIYPRCESDMNVKSTQMLCH